jgi:hypothetical protein
VLKGKDIKVNCTVLILKVGTCEEGIFIYSLLCHWGEKWWYVYERQCILNLTQQTDKVFTLGVNFF